MMSSNTSEIPYASLQKLQRLLPVFSLLYLIAMTSEGKFEVIANFRFVFGYKYARHR